MESSDPETKESSGGVDIEELHLHSITERGKLLEVHEYNRRYEYYPMESPIQMDV